MPKRNAHAGTRPVQRQLGPGQGAPATEIAPIPVAPGLRAMRAVLLPRAVLCIRGTRMFLRLGRGVRP